MRNTETSRLRRPGAPTLVVLGIVGCLGLVLAAAISTLASQHGAVEATSRVVLTYERDAMELPQDFDPAPTMLLTKSIESYSSLVTSENFLRRVIDSHHIDMTPDQLRSGLSITSPPDTTIMDFTVRGADSRTVEAAALGIGREFTAALAELESPAPIASVVLGPGTAGRTFPNAVLRTTVLTVLAVLTTVAIALMFVRRRSETSTLPITPTAALWRTS
ncbi:hypothetical protein [Gordonia terrae]|uniref:hypothetical protein n=1 Tax=Gordonia terrae TaxID=2055 RepID=UPI003F6BB3B2